MAGVVWLVITALLGLLAMPVTFGSGTAGTTLVTVCTDDGLRQVALDADGKSVPLPKPHHGKTCPFCSVHAGYVLPPPAASALPVAVQTVPADRWTEDAAFQPGRHFLIGRPSRAPPVRIA